MAVTGNFRGSPHIDTENVAPFYALALGEFTGGGRIAVESGVREVTPLIRVQGAIVTGGPG